MQDYASAPPCYLEHACLQLCPPNSDKAVSRTISIALDAQRARRGTKSRASVTKNSKAGEKREKNQLCDDRRGKAMHQGCQLRGSALREDLKAKLFLAFK